MAGTQEPFLPALVKAMQQVHSEGAEISTASFVMLMDTAVRVFDYLGTVLHVAKHDMAMKTASLHAVAQTYPGLREMVEADKAAGRATVKDSCARNLHRLACVIKFLRILFEQFASSPTMTTRDAANKAYEQSLAPLHIYVVRSAVWAGMYLLPTREFFMKELGETDESAMRHVQSFLECSQEVEHQILKLFAGITMPVSTPSSNILSSLWNGGAAPPPTANAATA